jgi:DNA-binding transcriptional LysR family regulator
MELRHLRYFVAVAEIKHFGRAAESLSTAQPSLSRQIRDLEGELGVELFVRTNHGVVLTDAGRIFLSGAKRTLAQADESARQVRENAEGSRGQLRLGFIAGAMMAGLPSVLRAYHRRFENVDVMPYPLNLPDFVPALYNRTIDIAWTIKGVDPEIENRDIGKIAILAAFPAGGPRAKGGPINIAEFSGQALVIVSRAFSPILYDDTLQLCATAGFRPTHIYEVSDVISILGLVAAGFGVALVPESWSKIHIDGIAFHEIDSKYRYSQVLCWQRERETPMVRGFVETALEVISGVDQAHKRKPAGPRRRSRGG